MNKIVFETDLTIAEVENKLKAITEPRRFRFFTDDQKFEGEISHGHFKLRRITRSPLILKGHVFSFLDFTKIELFFVLPMGYLLAFILFPLFFLLMFIIMIPAALGNYCVLLIPVGGLLIMFSILFFNIYLEKEKCIKLLKAAIMYKRKN